MIVKEQKEIELVNACNAIGSETYIKSAILWYTDKPVSRLKKVYMYGRYPAITIHKEKIHLHRLLAMFDLKTKDLRGKYVHHKNGNKLDCRITNLELVDPSEHQSKHNKGRKQSPEHVFKRISATVKTRYNNVYENPDLVKELV